MNTPKNEIINYNHIKLIKSKSPVHHLNIYLQNQLLDDFLRLKNRTKVVRDGLLVRPIVRLGLIGCNWLLDKDLFTINNTKLRKILSELSVEQQNELFELMRRDRGI